MTTEITPLHVRKLVSVQRGLLFRSDPVTLSGLGPFVPLFVDEHGWTADGPARARALLRGALDDFASRAKAAQEAAERARNFGSRDTAPRPARPWDDALLRAAAVRWLWGIDEHPLTGPEISRRIGALATHGGVQPGDSTIGRWRDELINDRYMLDWFANRAPAPLAPSVRVTDTAREIWSGRKSEWPPDRTWPPDSASGGIAERRYLLTRAGAILRASAGDGNAALFTDDVVLALLRDATYHELRDRRFAAPEHRPLARHVDHALLDAWRDSLTRQIGRDERVAEGGRWSGPTAVAAQMIMHSLVGDDVNALQKAGSDHLSRLRLTSNSERLATAVKRAKVVQDDLPVTEVADEIEQLYKLAVFIRLVQRPSAYLTLDYLDIRENLKVEDFDAARQIRLALADQSLSLDLARYEDHESLRRLARIVDVAPPSAYTVLVRRDLAILAKKLEHEDEAIALVSEAFEYLAILVEQGLVDARSAAEADHQLCLAAAGDHLRLLERGLVAAHAHTRYTPRGQRTADPRLRDWMLRALHYERLASTKLSEIDRLFDLPQKRHQDARIATVTWRIRTGITGLRIRLAAITAIGAGLVPGDDAYVDVLQAEVAYRRLLTRPELPTGEMPELATLGIWLSLLSGGLLPVELRAAPEVMAWRWLDDDPEFLIANASATRLVDLDGLTEELGARLRGVTVSVPIDGPVAEFLDRSSAGTYLPWRRRVDEIRVRDSEEASVLSAPRLHVGRTTVITYVDGPTGRVRQEVEYDPARS